MKKIKTVTFRFDRNDFPNFNIGNCFQTQSEAQAMADKFKELLKGGVE